MFYIPKNVEEIEFIPPKKNINTVRILGCWENYGSLKQLKMPGF